jgi:hypothetical protein
LSEFGGSDIDVKANDAGFWFDGSKGDNSGFWDAIFRSGEGNLVERIFAVVRGRLEASPDFFKDLFSPVHGY